MKHKPNLLLIEPDKILADIYRSALVKNQYNVVIVSNAQAGIYAVDKLLPDLIILELQLTKHSGVEFLYELRSYSEWQNIPVIILSMVNFSEFKNSSNILFNNLKVKAYYHKLTTSVSELLEIIQNNIAVV